MCVCVTTDGFSRLSQTQPCHWRRGKRSVPELDTAGGGAGVENSTADQRMQSLALFQSLQVLKDDEELERTRSDSSGTEGITDTMSDTGEYGVICRAIPKSFDFEKAKAFSFVKYSAEKVQTSF